MDEKNAILLTFIGMFIAMVYGTYFLEKGNIDFIEATKLFLLGLASIIIPAIMLIVILLGLYLLMEELGTTSLEKIAGKSSIKLAEIWPLNLVTILTKKFQKKNKGENKSQIKWFYSFFYLAFLYMFISLLIGNLLLWRFGAPEGRLAYFIPSIVLSFLLMYRFFKKLNLDRLAQLFFSTFLITVIFVFLQQMEAETPAVKILMGNLEQEILIVAVVSFDFFMFELIQIQKYILLLWKKN